MTPEEKMVWAAAFALAVSNRDLSPRYRAAQAVLVLRDEFHSAPATPRESAEMVDEMRGGK